jgi:Flp pilus assembly pilin Flp
MPIIFLTILVHAQTAASSFAKSLRDERGDDGQATTEYALVLLAAALVALLVVTWATAGGGSAKISRLFNKVIDTVTSRV